MAISELSAIPTQIVLLYIVSRMFSTEQFSIYYLLMSFTAVVSVFFAMNVGEGLLFYCQKNHLPAQEQIRPLRIVFVTQVIQHAILGLLGAVLFYIAIRAGLLRLSMYSYFAIWTLATTRNLVIVLSRYFTSIDKQFTSSLLLSASFSITPVLLVLCINYTSAERFTIDMALASLLCVAVWIVLCSRQLLYYTDPRPLSEYKPFLIAAYKYGISRIPVTFAMAFLFSSPSIYGEAMHMSPIHIVFLGFAGTMVRTLGFVQRFATMFLLPIAARTILNKDPNDIATLRTAILSVFHFSICTAAVALATGDAVMKTWINVSAQDVWPTSAILWATTGVTVAVYMLRPLIDGLHEKAHNTKSLFISLCVQVGLTFLLSQFISPVLAIIIGLSCGLLWFVTASVLTIRSLNTEILPPRIIQDAFLKSPITLITLACLALAGFSALYQTGTILDWALRGVSTSTSLLVIAHIGLSAKLKK